MIVIWRGLGIFAPLFVLIPGCVGSRLCEAAGASIPASCWGGIVGVCLGGVALWFVGRWLNRPDRDADGPSLHRLFYIPMEFWGPLLIFFGIVYFNDKRQEYNAHAATKQAPPAAPRPAR
jgi:hypothetical protein